MHFPLIVERLKENLPNDSLWWPLWLDSYSLPAFLASVEVGIFEIIAKDSTLTANDIATKIKTSVRTAKVLLNKMISLKLLYRTNTSTVQCSSLFFDMKNHPNFPTWIEILKVFPATAANYIQVLICPGNYQKYFELSEEPLLQPILKNYLSCAVLGIADEIDFFSAFPCSYRDLIQHRQKIHSEISEEAFDKHFLQILTTMNIISERDGLYSISPWVLPFVDKKSPFYKGGTFHLMFRGEPPSPEQSWKALENERIRLFGAAEKGQAETLMDQSTLEAENKAHLFALHMDAQGAGQDVVVAQK